MSLPLFFFKEWSREMLLEKWMKDAVSCCNSAGVEPPQSAFNATATYKDSSLLKNQDSCNNEVRSIQNNEIELHW